MTNWNRERCTAICDWCGGSMLYVRGQGHGWRHGRGTPGDAICWSGSGYWVPRSVTVLPGMKGLGTIRQTLGWLVIEEGQ